MSDGADEEMKRPRTEEEKQLETECRQLKESYTREKRLLVQFEQAGKRTEAFWHMEKKKLEGAKMDLRNKLRQKQDLQDKHEYEKRRYGEKVYHLFHEQFANVSDVKAEAEIMMTTKLRDFMIENDTDNIDRRSLLVRQKEMQQKHMELINQLRRDQELRIMEMRQKYELLSENLRQEYEEKGRVMRTSATTSRTKELKNIEQHKSKHIGVLMERHQKEFLEIRNYYNDVTRSNLDLIKTLKGEVQELQKAERSKEHGMLEIARANEQLKDPFQKHLDTIQALKTHVQDHTRDKADLSHTKGEIDELSAGMDKLQWLHGIQTQRYEKAGGELAQLEKIRTKAVFDVAQKADLQTRVLETKMECLCNQIEKQNALLGLNAELVRGKDGHKGKSLQEVLNLKNGFLDELEAALAEATERYYETISYFEACMAKHCISADNVGVSPPLSPQKIRS